MEQAGDAYDFRGPGVSSFTWVVAQWGCVS
jgi:hypothetical protein